MWRIVIILLALGGWQVESAAVLPLVPGASTRVFPSPHARSIAYHRAVRVNSHTDYFVCVGDADGEPTCYPPPQELPSGFEPDPNSHFRPFSWSPDGATLAVVGQPLVNLNDTDLWLLDVATGGWTSLTDDGYEGALADSTLPAGVSVEVQPVWSPDGTQIAVERIPINEQGEFAPSTLSLVDAATGAVRDLAPLAGSVTGMDWSRSTLAVSLRHPGGLDASSDGISLVDVERGEIETLVSVEEAESALQTVYPDVALEFIGPLSWSPDGSRLLFWAGNSTTTPIVTWPFWVTLDNGEITALALPAHPNDSGARRALRPLQAAWSPDGTALLVFAIGLHPDEPVTPLDPSGERARGGLRLIDVAAGTDTLLGNLPLGPATAFYIATWGPDSDAIINGYHVVMTSSD